jgi:hypothetical protein
VIEAPLAGESALAELTDVAAPRNETRAIAASDWKALARRFNLERPARWDEPVVELETWSYDPATLGSLEIVDPLSLWLSLPDSSDERLGVAKDMLLRQAKL